MWHNPLWLRERLPCQCADDCDDYSGVACANGCRYRRPPARRLERRWLWLEIQFRHHVLRQETWEPRCRYYGTMDAAQ